jgi:hypothetical protein
MEMWPWLPEFITQRGEPFDHYGRFADTWVYSNGKWVCVASHTSTLKKRP